MSRPYFRGASGRVYAFADLAARIRAERPDLVRAWLVLQLGALSLEDEFNGGTTPYALPYSFSDYDEAEPAADEDGPDETERSELAEGRGLNPWSGRAR